MKYVAVLPVLFVDEDLVAVHKPAGLLLLHHTGLDAHAARFALQIVRDQLGRHAGWHDARRAAMPMIPSYTAAP